MATHIIVEYCIFVFLPDASVDKIFELQIGGHSVNSVYKKNVHLQLKD